MSRRMTAPIVRAIGGKLLKACRVERDYRSGVPATICPVIVAGDGCRWLILNELASEWDRNDISARGV